MYLFNDHCHLIRTYHLKRHPCWLLVSLNILFDRIFGMFLDAFYKQPVDKNSRQESKWIFTSSLACSTITISRNCFLEHSYQNIIACIGFIHLIFVELLFLVDCILIKGMTFVNHACCFTNRVLALSYACVRK